MLKAKEIMELLDKCGLDGYLYYMHDSNYEARPDAFRIEADIYYCGVEHGVPKPIAIEYDQELWPGQIYLEYDYEDCRIFNEKEIRKELVSLLRSHNYLQLEV